MEYIHGHNQNEILRLQKLNELLNQSCLDKFPDSQPELILDVGSGQGQMAVSVSHKYNHANIIGVEKTPGQLTIAREQSQKSQAAKRIDFREGSALNLPLSQSEWGQIDLVYSRFLLEHLTDPLRAICQMNLALKKGGTIIIIDDDHANFQLYPNCSGFNQIWPSYCAAYSKLNNDPYIGRKLASYLIDCGFSGCRIDFIKFGACAQESLFPSYVQNLVQILIEAKEMVCEIAKIPSDEFNRSIEDIKEWSQLKTGALVYMANMAIGIKQ